MMAHAREQIRTAIKTALAGATAAGDQVFSGHVYPLTTTPAIAITTPEDNFHSESSSMGADSYLAQVQIAAHAAINAELDDALDDLCAEIHQVLMADTDLAALVKNLALLQTKVELAREGRCRPRIDDERLTPPEDHADLLVQVGVQSCHPYSGNNRNEKNYKN